MVEESSHEFLLGIGANQHKGLHIGIPSIYSANSWVIEAVLLHELNPQNFVLIELTCNQGQSVWWVYGHDSRKIF